MTLKYNPFTNKLDIVGSGGSGGGDVSGPGSSTDNAIVRWNGATGTLIQNSVATLSDTGDIVANSIDLTVPVSVADGGTNISSYTTGDLLYASGSNTLSKLAIGSDTQVLTVSGGVPTWAASAGGGVTSVSGTANRITSSGGATPVIDISASYVGQSSITTLGTITTGVWTGTTIAVANGGTGATTLTGVLTGNGTGAVTANAITQYGVVIGGASNAVASTAVGSAGQVLQSSGAGVNPAYSTATYPSTAAGTGTILRADGTNWIASTATYPNTATTGDIIYGSASNVYSNLGISTYAGAPLIFNGTNIAWFDPTKMSYWHDDFITGSPTSLVSWTQTPSGTAAAVNLSDTTNLATGIFGMISCLSGTDTNSRSGLRTDQANFFLDSSVDFLDFQWYAKLSALSDATDTYTLRMGYGDSSASASTDGLYFEYTHGTNSGNFQIVAAGSGSRTTSNTSTAASTNWTLYRIRATPTSVSFYINGSEVANSPITGANIPSGTSELFGINYHIQKSAGTTARIFSMDWVSHFKKMV